MRRDVTARNASDETREQPDGVPHTFAHKLRFAMEHPLPPRTKPYQQTEVAAAVGVARTTVGMWLRGTQPRIDQLPKLVEFFHRPLEWWLEDTSDTATAADTEPDPTPPLPVADAVRTLIAKRAALAGEDLTTEQAAQQICTRYTYPDSPTELATKLDSGDPPVGVLQLLARWAGIKHPADQVAYFTDPTTHHRINNQLDQLIAASRMRTIAARLDPKLATLSTEGFRQILAAIDQAPTAQRERTDE